MSALSGLQCHLCKATYPAEALWVCEKCLGPLEPTYDYASIKVTREEIEHAAQAAHALEFIRDMPMGFDTLIGENGVRLL